MACVDAPASPSLANTSMAAWLMRPSTCVYLRERPRVAGASASLSSLTEAGRALSKLEFQFRPLAREQQQGNLVAALAAREAEVAVLGAFAVALDHAGAAQALLARHGNVDADFVQRVDGRLVGRNRHADATPGELQREGQAGGGVGVGRAAKYSACSAPRASAAASRTAFMKPPGPQT